MAKKGEIKRPFVFLCTGMSLDGKLSNYKKELIEIATDDDKRMLYECRAKADAVMVGGHTLLQDDPKLIVKPEDKKRAGPIKVGIISDANDLKLKGDFFDVGEARRVIFTTERTSKRKIKQIKKKALIHVLGKERVNLKKSLEVLYDLGVRKLLVEGGGTLIFSLLKEGLVDEINLKIGNLLIGGKNSITLVEGEGFGKLDTKKVKFLSLKRKPNYLVLRIKPIN